MKRLLALIAVLVIATLPAHAQQGAYKVLSVNKVGGDGGFDYLYADSVGRKLYIPRTGSAPRVAVYDLDSLKPVGEIPGIGGHGVAVDANTHHGFVSSNPVAMFDSNTLAVIKTIPVSGSPDGILADAAHARVYIFSHRAPNVTVINTADGSIVGTIDLGGAPEEAQLDGYGHLYVALEDKGSIAVVDAAAMSLTKTLSLKGKGDGCAGLALDAKNGILFAACRKPQAIVALYKDGGLISDFPIGNGVDGAAFIPATGEVFAPAADGSLTIVHETGPNTLALEQRLATPAGCRTLTVDSKTSHLFCINAQYGPVPTPAPGTAPARRGPMVPGSFSIIVIGK